MKFKGNFQGKFSDKKLKKLKRWHEKNKGQNGTDIKKKPKFTEALREGFKNAAASTSLVNGTTNLKNGSLKSKISAHQSNGIVKNPRVEVGKLPIEDCKDSLVHELMHHSTFIIVGETGSGKSTQIPQYIFDAHLHKKKCIAITQPRRIAAISLARRVSDERGTDVGTIVGYSVRFEDTYSNKTRMKYLTDGMLLREAMLDPKLERYSWVIIDEAHERTISTDVLFGIVKRAQQLRSEQGPKHRLKIILMSATMDVESFERFYGNCKVLYARGREYPVQINYLKEKPSDYDMCNNVIKTVFKIHRDFSHDHHVLVFLTGQEEIESTAHIMKKVTEAHNILDLFVCTLYGSLPYELQIEALEPAPPGRRKCILATNIAETSLTIPGVKIVVDCGKVKMKFHVKGTQVNRLSVMPIAQAQAWQRSGRAGRQAPGQCFRLYTSEEFGAMEQFPVPEIQRTSMASSVLQLVKIGVTSPLTFPWVDPPKKEAMQEAIKSLVNLGALKSIEEPLELTDVGLFLAKVPLEPAFGKTLFISNSLQVVEPVLTILSILSGDNLLVAHGGKPAHVKERFRAPEGDLLSYLKIYREFKKQKQASERANWCKINGVNHRTLEFAAKVRSHLRKICESDSMNLQTNVSGLALNDQIRKAFFLGLQGNTATLERSNQYFVKSPGQKGIYARIHPASVLMNSRAPSIVFSEITQVSKDVYYLCHNTLINSEWL